MSHAIATAVSQNKKRVVTGKKPGTKARAAKATAEWYALRAKSKIKSRVAKTSVFYPDILEGVSDPAFDLDLTEFSFDVPIAKIDEDKQLAFGWASVAKRRAERSSVTTRETNLRTWMPWKTLRTSLSQTVAMVAKCTFARGSHN